MDLVRIARRLTNRTFSSGGVTLITPTGDRPIPFQQSELYFSRQTYAGKVQWIVSDDGLEPTTLTKGQHLVRNKSAKELGCCPNDRKAESITGNVLAALEHVEYDRIIIWEDDDYYDSRHISQQLTRLNNYALVGEGIAHYYNVHERAYRINRNTKHASFCQTALRAEALYALFTSCHKRTSSFIDSRLWQKTSLKKMVFQDTRYVIGIKGMPGRSGAGMGHRPYKGGERKPTLRPGFKLDHNLSVLSQWLPKEFVDYYAQFYNT